MHKVRVGAGVAGVTFTVGSLVIFLLGIPALWGFLALSLGLGLLVAVVLRFAQRHDPQRWLRVTVPA